MRTVGRSRRLVALVGLLGLLVGLVGAGVVARPASGAASGAVRGVVTGPDGAPLAGVAVQAVPYPASMTSYDAVTAADGTYTVPGLADGSYRLWFNPGVSSPLAPEYYADKTYWSAADPVAVTGGAVTDHVDAQLVAKGSIRGTVTGPDGGPVGGVRVDYTPTVAPMSLSAVTTASDGTFVIDGLVPDTYDLYLTAALPLVNQWFDRKPDRTQADHVVVAPGAVTTVAPRLQIGGVVSGTVSAGGGPLAGATVMVSPVAPSTFRYVAVTSVDGTYRVTGIPTGTYVVGFSPPTGSPYSAETWNDRHGLEPGDPVAVQADSEVTGIDAVLDLKGAISGRVTNAAGAPLAGVVATALVTWPGGTTYTATTGPDGTYTITGLPLGTYRVGFGAPAGSGYRPEWFDDEIDIATADPVVVGAEVATAGIDAVLVIGGGVSGTITGPAGEAIDGSAALLYPVIGGGPYRAPTDASGHYAIDGLSPGQYRVQFQAPTGYATEWYQDRPDQATADLVTVVDGVVTGPIDGRLANVMTDVQVTVMTTSSTPAADATVDFFRQPAGPVTSARTDAAGVLRITLRSGLYTMRVTPQPPYAAQWWSGKSDASSADPFYAAGSMPVMLSVIVSVPVAATVGSIAGHVTSTRGPLPDVTVTVMDAYRVVATATTDASGAYRVPDLAPGWYRVEFAPAPSSGYVGTTQGIDVAAGRDVTLDQTLYLVGGRVTGTVTGPDDRPLPGVMVSFRETRSGGGSTMTDAQGRYTIEGLANGDYRIGFTPADRSLLEVWFLDKPSEAMGDIRSIVQGEVVVIDAQLRAPAAIEGRISGPAGEPVVGVTVTAHGPYGSTATTTTGSTPDYALTGLWPGTYTLDLTPPPGSAYAPRQVTAILTAGQTSSLGITLDAIGNAAISGKVTAPRNPGAMTVRVLDPTGALVAAVATSDDGRFTITGLAAGTYVVLAVPPAGAPYVPTYHAHATVLAKAERVTVAAGRTVRNVNVALQPAPKPVVPKAQTISFGPIADRVVGSAPFALVAKASSGLAVSFTTDTPSVCALDGRTVSLLAPGTCVIRASQSGNDRYRPAPDVTRTFTVKPASPSASYPDAVKADSPLAYWRLGEGTGTAVDSSGRGHAGAYLGATERADGALRGDPDGAVALNMAGPTNGQVVVPDDGTLALPGDLTIEAWVKPMGSPGNYQMIVTKSPGANAGAPGQLPADYELWLDPSLRPQLRLTVGVGNPIVSADRTLTAGRWTHLAVTRSGRLVTFYVDGAVAGASTIDRGEVRTNALPVRIGSRADERIPAYFAFRGFIDEVALYDHALTAARVAAHAAAR